MPNIMWPWGVGVQQDPNAGVQKPPVYGPFQLPDLGDGAEFGPIEFVQTSVSKVSANLDRIFRSTADDTTRIQATEPKWYDLPGRFAKASGAFNDAMQSTLTKIIVLVAIVGVVAIFGLSYVQAKGINLAK